MLFARELLEMAPTSSEAGELVGIILINLGESQQDLGLLAEAKKTFEEAQTILSELTSQNPSDISLGRNRASLNKDKCSQYGTTSAALNAAVAPD